jgi:hypothetical protein
VCGDLTIEFGDLTIESHASSWFVFWLESWMNVWMNVWIHHKSDESHPSKLGGKFANDVLWC